MSTEQRHEGGQHLEDALKATGKAHKESWFCNPTKFPYGIEEQPEPWTDYLIETTVERVVARIDGQDKEGYTMYSRILAKRPHVED